MKGFEMYSLMCGFFSSKKLNFLFGLFLFAGFFTASGIEKNPDDSVEIFWLKRPMIFPEKSIQYLRLPMSGWKEPSSISNFRYVLTVPDAFEILDSPLRIVQELSDSMTASVYPVKIERQDPGNGFKRYILHYNGVGTAGVSLWFMGDAKNRFYCPVVDIGSSRDWQDYYSELTVEKLVPVSAALALYRWPDRFSDVNVRQCYGTVDVDDLEISEKGPDGNSKVIFKCDFDNKSPDAFSWKGSDGISLKEENGNRFLNFDITETLAASRQKAESGSLTLEPLKTYIVRCRARSQVRASARNYLWSPVFVKSGGALPETVEIRARYEYERDGRTISGREEKLAVKTVSSEVRRPSHMEIAIWSQAEESLGLQSEKVRDILIDITKRAGVKTHITKTLLSPWDAPYNGNADKVPAINPVESAIRKAGMRVVPYLCGYDIAAGVSEYLTHNPEFQGVNAFGGKVYHTWQSKKQIMFCPSKILDPGCVFWKRWLEYLEKAANANHWDGVFYDYEVGFFLGLSYSGTNWNLEATRCFCPECVKRFKQFSGIADIGAVPERAHIEIQKGFPYDKLAGPAKDILTNYPLEWLKFRAEQTGLFWESIRSAVRKANPQAGFHLYSGGYSVMHSAENWRSCEYYGIYPAIAGRYIDSYYNTHWPVKGTFGRAEIEMMREALSAGSSKKIPVLNCISSWSNPPKYTLAKNDFVQAFAVSGANGVQIYIWTPTFDAQTWSLVREGVDIVTSFEDYFINGTRADYLVSIDKPFNYSVWARGEDRVIFVFNDTALPQRVNIKHNDIKLDINSFGLPSKNRFEARDFQTGKLYPDPAKFDVLIPPSDLAVIQIKAK